MQDSSPRIVADVARSAYRNLSSSTEVGLFDERDYLLGEFGLLAGGALRHLGKHDESISWLDCAETAFQRVIPSAPSLARVSYARLALLFDARRFEEIVDLIPLLIHRFRRLEMQVEVRKSEFLWAMALKQCGRDLEAFTQFSALRDVLEGEGERALLGRVLIETGSYLAAEGRQDEALADFARAAELLSAIDEPMVLGHLNTAIGENLRNQGQIREALAAFRSAVLIYLELQVPRFVAYARIFVADVLLKLNRPREAETEILAALPIIEDQKMVADGFVAIALLKESVRASKTDPNALRELREHLRGLSKRG
jgi:tetratricopeptide (TPR) repeat protein